jgi:hypothetical protein
LAFGSQAIAVAADRDDVAVLQESIEDGGGNHDVAAQLPLRNRTVACYQHRTALKAAADELEEQMRRVPLERQIPELIDPELLGLTVVMELIFQSSFGENPSEAGDESCRGHEERGVAARDRLLSKRPNAFCPRPVGRGAKDCRR